MEKTCSKCKQTKPVENFYKIKRDKLHSWCRNCCLLAQKKYYTEHREERMTYNRRYSVFYWRSGRMREYQKKYREANREKVREYHRQYYRKRKAFYRSREAHALIHDCAICALRAEEWRESQRALGNYGETKEGYQKHDKASTASQNESKFTVSCDAHASISTEA